MKKIIIVITLLIGLADISLAATFNVNSTADSIDANTGDCICLDGSGNCTLRAAVHEAMYCTGTDTINIPAGTYILTIAGLDEDIAETGDLDLLDSQLVIAGAGADVTFIDGGGIDRVFHADPNAVGIFGIQISGVTIQNGDPRASATDTQGGGLLKEGSGDLTLDSVVITGNRAQAGGGIYINDGATTITKSVISNNETNNGGAGIFSNNLSALTVKRSTIMDNETTNNSGGGFLAMGTTTIENSTIHRNTAWKWAGGFYSEGTNTIKNSTITLNSGNSEASHLAIPIGDGIYVYSGTLDIANTIVADNNNDFENCAVGTGTITSLGNNIDGSDTCNFIQAGDLINTDPLLAALDSSGDTPILPLTTISPAIDAGNNAECLAVDQRGISRPQDGDDDGIDICDIGAFELPAASTGGGGGSSAGGGCFIGTAVHGSYLHDDGNNGDAH